MRNEPHDEAFSPNQILALCLIIGLSLIGLAIGYTKNTSPAATESIQLQSIPPRATVQNLSPTPLPSPPPMQSANVSQANQITPAPTAQAEAPSNVVDQTTKRQAVQVAQQKLNINTATAEDFDSLPGIGPVLSKRIVEMRTRLGGFSDVEQLIEVDGIGEKRLNTIRPYLVVAPR